LALARSPLLSGGPGQPDRLIRHLKSFLGITARVSQHHSHGENALVTTTFEIAFALPPADCFIDLVLLDPDVVGITITTEGFHKFHHLRGEGCGQRLEPGTMLMMIGCALSSSGTGMVVSSIS
jgi:hypothetical protein